MTASNPLIQALLASLNQHKSQLHGKRVWLACSGGRDSLSLAMLCRYLFDRGRLPFLPQLLHVNHGIQEANAAWSEQVAKWSKQQQMPCRILNLALQDKSEQSARHARYHAMMSVMNTQDVLLLGHHQDDQVETVLMRLFNGTGVTGLGGMSAWTPKQKFVSNTLLNMAESTTELNECIYLWRPWLSISRAQITAYAKASGLDYIDDPTNVIAIDTVTDVDTNIDTVTNINVTNANHHSLITKSQTQTENIAANINDRAWLRSTLMPLIYERYPQAHEAISRTSQLMQDASRVINEQVDNDLAYLRVHCPSTQSITELYSVIDIAKLQQMLPARQSALLHSWLSPNRWELPAPKRLVDDILALCQRNDSDHQTRLYWDSGFYQYDIRRYQHNLYRLRSDWVQWLSLNPIALKIDIEISNHNPEGLTSTDDDLLAEINLANTSLVDSMSLKPSHPTISWQLTSIHGLVRALATADESYHHNPPLKQLCFEPLPRRLKVALADREGRKFGKKLLQAIQQPSFLRESIVLCYLQQHVDDNENTVSNNKTPLCLIALDHIYPLQSPFSNTIKTLVNRHILSTQVVYNTV